MRLVIVGNGGAAVSAVRTLRTSGWRGEIMIVSHEPVSHYSPILLPYYIEGRISQAGLCYLGPRFYKEYDVRFVRSTAVVEVDVGGKYVILDGGGRIPYDRLLIATGASPARPPISGADGGEVLVLRTLADADRLRKLNPQHTAIVGTGAVAVELAIALVRSGKQVTLIGRSRVMRRIFDPDISNKIAKILVAHGVDVLLRQSEIAIMPQRVVTAEHTIDCDAVVVAAGVRPNTDFLNGTGIELGDKGGIIVDSRMRTSSPGIYAAGDCVQAPDFSTGKPVINAIWPEAIEQGRIAALDILDAEATYRGGIPRNVINIFDIPALSVGYLTGTSHTHAFPGGWVTTYNQDGLIVGMEIIGELRRHGYLPVVYKRSTYPNWLRQAVFALRSSSLRPRYRMRAMRGG